MSSKKPKVAKLQTMPTTVTTGFGTGSYNPATGNVGYTLDDQLAQLRDIFYGAAGDFLPSEQQQQYAQQVGQFGQTLFGNATNRDLQSQISDYYQQQQNMLAPERDRESARLQDSMFASGRLGYGTGTTGGYINPQQFALQQAREQQNAGLLLGAEDRARAMRQQDIAQALGLADSSAALQLQPYQQASGLFNIGAGIEGLGMNTLNTVGQFAPIQANWQQALQANQQAINNAKASGGSFLGALGGNLLNAGLSQATGGFGSALGTSLGTSLGNWASGLFSTNPANALNTYKNPYTSTFGTVVA